MAGQGRSERDVRCQRRRMKADDNNWSMDCRFFFERETSHVNEALGTAAEKRYRDILSSGVSPKPPITLQSK
jgi:hypothetical protein